MKGLTTAVPPRITLCVALAALGGALVVQSVRAQDGGIAVGARPPAAAVQTLDGKPVALASLVGSGPAVVEFWATWCPNCKELEPTLAAAQKKYAGQVRFVTVAVAINESIDRVRRHFASHDTSGTVVYDAGGNAASAYDAPATSYVVVIDRNGKVAYTGVGGTQDLDAAIRKAL
jgi:thiol-disulfide isomerase/thioredoxin